MAIYKKPPDSDEESEKLHDQEKPQPERKLPEFIFVDSDLEDKAPKIGIPHQDPKQIFGSVQTIAKRQQPFYLRILFFLATFVMIVLSTFILVIALISMALSLLFLRQSKYFNEGASSSWRSFKKAIVCTLGCIVSIFNLSFGVGIVLMYFMLSGEKLDNRFVQQFTKHQE